MDQTVLTIGIARLEVNFETYFQLADGLDGWKMQGIQGFAVHGVFWAPPKKTLKMSLKSPSQGYELHT